MLGSGLESGVRVRVRVGVRGQGWSQGSEVRVRIRVRPGLPVASAPSPGNMASVLRSVRRVVRSFICL